MLSTEEHYAQLLGLLSPWTVDRVKLSLDSKRVDIFVSYSSNKGDCPECGKTCDLYDRSPNRTWRHLDTMQFATHIHCETPRLKCSKHGVKTIALPWAGKHSRFTLLFEVFAIKVISASRSIQDACYLLGINWHQAHAIMQRAVERGLQRRQATEIAWIGMDEKSFRKGHRYISLLNDLEDARVLEVVEGRDGVVADRLLTEGLDTKQREMVCGVAIDMSAPFINAIRRHLPHADIVHDKFHIAKHLNESVDKTRRIEHAQLQKQKDNRLKGTKYAWLRSGASLSEGALEELEALSVCELKVAKAWHLKELFAHFWKQVDKAKAQNFFNHWYEKAVTAGLPEVVKVAHTLKRHFDNIITYFDSYITNAVSEGLNSKIQTIKSNARGFRSFKNYRTSILFFCGKLNMLP